MTVSMTGFHPSLRLVQPGVKAHIQARFAGGGVDIPNDTLLAQNMLPYADRPDGVKLDDVEAGINGLVAKTMLWHSFNESAAIALGQGYGTYLTNVFRLRGHDALISNVQTMLKAVEGQGPDRQPQGAVLLNTALDIVLGQNSAIGRADYANKDGQLDALLLKAANLATSNQGKVRALMASKYFKNPSLQAAVILNNAADQDLHIRAHALQAARQLPNDARIVNLTVLEATKNPARQLFTAIHPKEGAVPENGRGIKQMLGQYFSNEAIEKSQAVVASAAGLLESLE